MKDALTCAAGALPTNRQTNYVLRVLEVKYRAFPAQSFLDRQLSVFPNLQHLWKQSNVNVAPELT